MTAKLEPHTFRRIARLIKRSSGINLRAGKEALVRGRLRRRLRQLGLNSFDDYMHYVEADHKGSELVALLDAIATNTTGFFREKHHFTFLESEVLPAFGASAKKERRRLRIWSAGCSSGEEAYSIAMTLATARDSLAVREAKIIATDLSVSMLEKARRGVYGEDRLTGLSRGQKRRYFRCLRRDPEKRYVVRDELRNNLCFRRVNLVDPWPLEGPFDVIFCRNVMIYFDRSTQDELIRRFFHILRPGGILFVGHAECLAQARRGFSYLRPTIYRRPSVSS